MLRYYSRDHKYKKPFGAVAAETAIAFLVESAPETKRCKMYVRREGCSIGEEDLQWLVIGVDQGLTKEEDGTEIRSWSFIQPGTGRVIFLSLYWRTGCSRSYRSQKYSGTDG